MMDECLSLDESELKDCVEIDFVSSVEREIVIEDIVDDEKESLDEWGAFEYDQC